MASQELFGFVKPQILTQLLLVFIHTSAKPLFTSNPVAHVGSIITGMPLIYVTGPSGAGKSTVCNELLRRGYEAHDTDENELVRNA
jgi:putative ribosome biogenesis GTPase RsgA